MGVEGYLLKPIDEEELLSYVQKILKKLEEEGKISFIFPDLGNPATFGDNVADAMRMAQDACSLYLFTALRDGEVLPVPSSLSEINPAVVLKALEMESAMDSAFVNMVLVDMTEYAKQHSDKAVKKTLSIPL